jgi:hypothetical protein
MNAKRFSEIVCLAGVLAIAASVTWWAISYRNVISSVVGPRDTLANFTMCIYSNGGPCTLIQVIARARGHNLYAPMYFWISAGILTLGVLLRIRAGRASH